MWLITEQSLASWLFQSQVVSMSLYYSLSVYTSFVNFGVPTNLTGVQKMFDDWLDSLIVPFPFSMTLYLFFSILFKNQSIQEILPDNL